MAVEEFGPWMPDRPDYRNPGVITATDVFPAATGYTPVKQFVSSTDALDARPRGATQAVDTSGTVFQYTGDATKLYRNISNAWTDATRTVGGAYTTGSDERWEFVAWQDKVLAVNFSDDPQQITMGNANFEVLTTDFRARHITAIRDFVVVANTFDSTDGTQTTRVRWSAFNDETDWTVSASTLADFQDLKTEHSDRIERIFGGEFGVIFQTDNTWRMTFVGAPVVFQFDEVLPNVGLIAPGAAAQDGDVIYFLSDRGFFALVNGAQANPIGSGIVDEFVLNDLDKGNLNRISATNDPTSKRIFWAYPGAGNLDGRPNKIVVYDRVFNKWAIIEEDVELIWRAGGTGTTLDALDSISGSIDALGVSLDSSRWVGGAPELGAFDQLFQSGFFDGDPKVGTIETGEIDFHDGGRARLNGFRPIVDGGSFTAQVGTRNSQSDAVTFGPSLTPRPEGRIPTRSNARYHRFRFTLSGEWTHAVGIQIDPDDIKRSGRRG